MSEEQLAALVARIKEDTWLQEKLKEAAGLEAVVAIAREAGFDVSKADWHKYQEKLTSELSDEELEGIAGGTACCDRSTRGMLDGGSRGGNVTGGRLYC